MAIKGSRTIAEYAIRKWLENEGFQMEWFNLDMNGNEATLTDRSGDKMKIRYDSRTHEVAAL